MTFFDDGLVWQEFLSKKYITVAYTYLFASRFSKFELYLEVYKGTRVCTIITMWICPYVREACIGGGGGTK